MKTNKLKLTLILLVCLNFLTSISVSSQYASKNNGNIKSIALVSTIIGKIVQSPIPLLDAPPFNKKTNSIAPLIIKEEEQTVDKYREAVAECLKKHFNCEILYGNTLTSKLEYQEVIKKYNFPDNLKIDNENFPKIIIPTDETNLFKFDNGNKVYQFLRNEDNMKNSAAEICKLLGTDLIAVFYSNMWVAKYGMFGGHAKLSMFISIFFYNKDGKLVAATVSNGKPTVKAVGDVLIDYKTTLGNFSIYLDDLILLAKKNM